MPAWKRSATRRDVDWMVLIVSDTSRWMQLTVRVMYGAEAWPRWTFQEPDNCWPVERTWTRPRRQRAGQIWRAICSPVGRFARTAAPPGQSPSPPTTAELCVRPVYKHQPLDIYPDVFFFLLSFIFLFLSFFLSFFLSLFLSNFSQMFVIV